MIIYEWDKYWIAIANVQLQASYGEPFIADQYEPLRCFQTPYMMTCMIEENENEDENAIGIIYRNKSCIKT